MMTGPVLGDAALGSAVIASGGDWRSIQRELAERAVEIDGQIRRNGTQALSLGLGGTPGYLIGPILVRGALTEAQFTRAFRDVRQSR